MGATKESSWSGGSFAASPCPSPWVCGDCCGLGDSWAVESDPAYKSRMPPKKEQQRAIFQNRLEGWLFLFMTALADTPLAVVRTMDTQVRPVTPFLNALRGQIDKKYGQDTPALPRNQGAKRPRLAGFKHKPTTEARRRGDTEKIGQGNSKRRRHRLYPRNTNLHVIVVARVCAIIKSRRPTLENAKPISSGEHSPIIRQPPESAEAPR